MYDKDLRLHSLLFRLFTKQPPSSHFKSVIGDVICNKMEISGVSDGDIVEVRTFKLNSFTTRQDAIAPVLVKFRSKEIARKVFELKSKLAHWYICIRKLNKAETGHSEPST